MDIKKALEIVERNYKYGKYEINKKYDRELKPVDVKIKIL